LPIFSHLLILLYLIKIYSIYPLYSISIKLPLIPLNFLILISPNSIYLPPPFFSIPTPPISRNSLPFLTPLFYSFPIINSLIKYSNSLSNPPFLPTIFLINPTLPYFSLSPPITIYPNTPYNHYTPSRKPFYSITIYLSLYNLSRKPISNLKIYS
jgi:hypothetical protein